MDCVTNSLCAQSDTSKVTIVPAFILTTSAFFTVTRLKRMPRIQAERNPPSNIANATYLARAPAFITYPITPEVPPNSDSSTIPLSGFPRRARVANPSIHRRTPDCAREQLTRASGRQDVILPRSTCAVGGNVFQHLRCARQLTPFLIGLVIIRAAMILPRGRATREHGRSEDREGYSVTTRNISKPMLLCSQV